MGPSIQGIGEHPRSEPDMVFPCAECTGEAASQAVHDNFYNLKYDDAIPQSSRCEFEEKFGDVIVKMAGWAYHCAVGEASRQDNEPCEMHRPSREDEE